jgi:NAD(P)H-dependent FMN reductase
VDPTVLRLVASALRLVALVAAMVVGVIATPEYDYAIPGVLTSALDWTLRSHRDRTPFRHKPVGIVGLAREGPEPPGARWSLGRYSCTPRHT